MSRGGPSRATVCTYVQDGPVTIACLHEIAVSAKVEKCNGSGSVGERVGGMRVGCWNELFDIF